MRRIIEKGMLVSIGLLVTVSVAACTASKAPAAPGRTTATWPPPYWRPLRPPQRPASHRAPPPLLRHRQQAPGLRHPRFRSVRPTGGQLQVCNSAPIGAAEGTRYDVSPDTVFQAVTSCGSPSLVLTRRSARGEAVRNRLAAHAGTRQGSGFRPTWTPPRCKPRGTGCEPHMRHALLKRFTFPITLTENLRKPRTPWPGSTAPTAKGSAILLPTLTSTSRCTRPKSPTSMSKARDLRLRPRPMTLKSWPRSRGTSTPKVVAGALTARR